jgi:hypothetical protein
MVVRNADKARESDRGAKAIGVLGCFTDKVSDVSEEHDTYLAEAIGN